MLPSLFVYYYRYTQYTPTVYIYTIVNHFLINVNSVSSLLLLSHIYIIFITIVMGKKKQKRKANIKQFICTAQFKAIIFYFPCSHIIIHLPKQSVMCVITEIKRERQIEREWDELRHWRKIVTFMWKALLCFLSACLMCIPIMCIGLEGYDAWLFKL